MTGRLDGKAIFVTGAASGLGKAMTQRFVAEGARVVIADIDAEGARRSPPNWAMPPASSASMCGRKPNGLPRSMAAIGSTCW